MTILQEILGGFKEILVAPFSDLSVFWLLAPVLILWAVMELYFDSHKKEKLGWNTALGNGISMFWIAINLLRYIFTNTAENFTWPKFISVSIIMLYALFIGIISFKHSFGAKVTFALASPSAVYYLSIIAVLWGYGTLVLTWWVILDIALLFGLILLFELILRHFIKESEKDDADDSVDSGSDFGGSSFDSGSDFGASSENTGSDTTSDFNDMKF